MILDTEIHSRSLGQKEGVETRVAKSSQRYGSLSPLCDVMMSQADTLVTRLPGGKSHDREGLSDSAVCSSESRVLSGSIPVP